MFSMSATAVLGGSVVAWLDKLYIKILSSVVSSWHPDLWESGWGSL